MNHFGMLCYIVENAVNMFWSLFLFLLPTIFPFLLGRQKSFLGVHRH